MPPAFNRFLTCSTVVFICVCVECGNFQIQPLKSNLSTVRRIGINKIPDTVSESTLNSDQTTFFLEGSVENLSGSRPNITLTKHFPNDLEVPKVVNKELTEFALEGGGIGVPSQNLSVKHRDGGVFDDEFHNKGSKGRKGVTFPGSSVVPRKGVSVAVDQLVNLPSNNSANINTFSNKSLAINNTKIVIDSNASIGLSINPDFTKPQEKIKVQENPNVILNRSASHSRKPEYVSDKKDVDEFEKYSIIKTSTTGEDYVIIGIVIVIGIWFSVFGALIFYRRAGEYWDRRHYRRMDFLVEGMYND